MDVRSDTQRQDQERAHARNNKEWRRLLKACDDEKLNTKC